MSTQQVETATVIGTVTGTGNASVVVTSAYMSASPKTISVAVTNGDADTVVGGLIRTALAFDADISAQFLVSGSGANVVLTSHVAKANDTTLNISIDNGTCTGLTAAPTSTNTTAGTGISNGYCTIADYKNWNTIDTISTSDDAVIEDIIESVSRFIDAYCGREFYLTSLTARYFNTENPLTLDTDDIASTSGLTVEVDLDGDGTYETVLTSDNYNTLPYQTRNDWPYIGLELSAIPAYSFSTLRKGNKITALWGWSAIPDDVKTACLIGVDSEYHARNGQNLSTDTRITAMGVVITPGGLPTSAKQKLIAYRKIY